MPAAQYSRTERGPEAGRKLRNVVYGLFAVLIAAAAAAGFAPEIKAAIRPIKRQAEDAEQTEAEKQSDSESEGTRGSTSGQSSKKESQAQKQTTFVLALYAFFIPAAILLIALLALAFKFHPTSWHITLPHYKPHPQ